MPSNNLFYNLYNAKSDNELKAIIGDDHYEDDGRLCAIQILRERNILIEDIDQIEKELLENRDFKKEAIVAQERYSTGVERFVALVIDGIAISIISGILNFFSKTESAVIIGVISVVNLIIPYLYNILLHGYYGQTFGKMFMNVKIFDKSEKLLITYKQALLRDIVPLSIMLVAQVITFIQPGEPGILNYITFVFSFTVIIWSILEIITMLFDSKRRALHDYIAGTVVLKVR